MKKRFTIIYFLFFPLFFLSSSFCLAMPALAPRQMVKDFLVSASCGDSSKAMTYLSQKADKSIVDTFINLFINEKGGSLAPLYGSGWELTFQEEWKFNEKIDENRKEATVTVGIIWKGGSPTIFKMIRKTFLLVDEDNTWMILKLKEDERKKTKKEGQTKKK